MHSGFLTSRSVLQPFQQQNHENHSKITASKSLLCNQLIDIKRLEIHQKKATQLFSSAAYHQCFQELRKCDQILKASQFPFEEHRVYVSYLFAEFHFKLHQVHNCKFYVNQILSNFHLRSSQNQYLKQYLANLELLRALIALEEQDFIMVFQILDEIRSAFSENKFPSKIRRRMSLCFIQGCIGLGKIEEALKYMDFEKEALQSDTEISIAKRQVQSHKLILMKMSILTTNGGPSQAMQYVEGLLNLDQPRLQSSFCLESCQILDSYLRLMENNQPRFIKSIHILHLLLKYSQVPFNQQLNHRLTLSLFRLYYEVGHFEAAQQIFAKRASLQFFPEDEIKLSEIHHILDSAGSQVKLSL